MKSFLFNIILIITLISCDDHQMDRLDSRITLTKSATGYTQALSGNPDENGDPFNLQHFEIMNDSAFITVSYSGGCKQHTFEVIWSENYDKSIHPRPICFCSIMLIPMHVRLSLLKRSLSASVNFWARWHMKLYL